MIPRMLGRIVSGGLFLLAFTSAALAASTAPASSDPKTLQVLFIGNSYTYVNDLPALVKQLLAARGVTLVSTSVTPGGTTLEKNWNDGQALAAIRSHGWDFVVLQEQSQRPFLDPKPMEEFAKRFDSEIKQAGAKTLLYETWAAKASPEEQPKLTAEYEKIGRELNATVVPVGEAWKRALARGFELHGPDGRHPALTGSYLAACVFVRALNQSGVTVESVEVRRNGRPRTGLSLEQALAMESIADETWKQAHR